MRCHQMRDIDIRRVLRKTTVKAAIEEDPTTCLIEELGIFQGKHRIDMALVNGLLHGYEIKSESDTLERLPAQKESYNQIFDKITLVADEHHVEEAMKIVPSWWGLTAAREKDGSTSLDEIWPARRNHNVDPYALCQLLWRDEALAVLKANKLASGMWHLPRKKLWRKLADNIEVSRLRAIVRAALCGRNGWT